MLLTRRDGIKEQRPRGLVVVGGVSGMLEVWEWHRCCEGREAQRCDDECVKLGRLRTATATDPVVRVSHLSGLSKWEKLDVMSGS